MGPDLRIWIYSFGEKQKGREEPVSYTHLLGAMWKYDLSGAPVVYSLKDNGTPGTQKDKLTDEDLLDNDCLLYTSRCV